jgi:hypothetical protein
MQQRKKEKIYFYSEKALIKYLSGAAFRKMNNANASSLHRNAENGINSKIKSFE